MATLRKPDRLPEQRENMGRVIIYFPDLNSYLQSSVVRKDYFKVNSNDASIKTRPTVPPFL